MGNGNGQVVWKDSVQLVLGATGGIGRSVAQRLHECGATVVVAGRDGDAVNAMSSELNTPACILDAESFDAVDTCFTQVVERQGRVDGVVNCVGSVMLKPAHLTSEAEYAQVLATNLHSAFATVRSAGRVMRAHGGSVVLLATAAAMIGLPNHEAIAAAKGGVIGLTLSAAATYAPHGIRFNAIAPGLVETPATHRIVANETSRDASLAMHALGRFGQPADIAAAVEWLLSPQSSWVTGQVIGVDGGLSRVRGRPTRVAPAR